MKRRGSGILLHITSLPSPHGIGDFGPWAYRFADFLAAAQQSFWQVLPLHPTSPAYGNSPYSSDSAFAGNPLFISLEKLQQEGWLEGVTVSPPPPFPAGRVDYQAVTAYKEQVLGLVYAAYRRNRRQEADFTRFCREQAFWLEDYALFRVLKAHFQGTVWSQWPPAIREREEEALQRFRQRFDEQIEQEKFFQYLFFTQWSALKDYCHRKGIQLIGDIPIYVNYDSADVWSHPELFKLDEHKQPRYVAGVPPDYFSASGQLWGNPVYDWEELKRTRYAWWVERIRHNLQLFDLVRLDHFRGFVAYWEVPAGESTAIRGQWIPVPSIDFFSTLFTRFPCLPLIAEDLGLITPEVREVMQRFHFPGMKVLLFAFGPDLPTNPYIPHNHIPHCVVYTGTHDNNTVQGWWQEEASPEDRARLSAYLGREVPASQVHWELVRLAMMSVASLVIFPLQDILGLGAEARMNRPATSTGNWEWRVRAEQLTPEISERLARMTRLYGRGTVQL
ncbi:MAG: 4-alpha-glucanotransferase [Nitrospinota bacterium]|nr:MAG: 4-alpha-glucanotransferase [Nitrospinota bacterium]